MCIICRGDYKGYKHISCNSCPLVTHIPCIMGLRKLECQNCVSLVSIANIPGLKKLDCSGCISLQSIPQFERLKYLNCSHTFLTEIPYIKTLKTMLCVDCPILHTINRGHRYIIRNGRRIPIMDSIIIWNIRKCPWLDHESNRGIYEKNIIKLIRLQTFVRKRLLYRKLSSWVNTPEFNEWYYHPDNPGGKKAIRRLFIKNK